MTYLKKMLTNSIKILFGDVRSSIVSIIVLSALGSGSIFLSVKKLWRETLAAIQSPTPLWVTIALVLALLVYIYLKTRTRPQNPPELKPKYHTIDEIKWEYFFNDDNSFHVNETPLCAKHNLPMFKCDAGYDCHERPVDHCNSLFPTKDYQNLYNKALSHIYRKINFPE